MKMVGKLKRKFLPTGYQLDFLRRIHNLRLKDMIVKDYIEEFYKQDIRYGHVDDEVKKVSRHLDDLRTSIQDEISFIKMESVEATYLYALKAEENLAKK